MVFVLFMLSSEPLFATVPTIGHNPEAAKIAILTEQCKIERVELRLGLTSNCVAAVHLANRPHNRCDRVVSIVDGLRFCGQKTKDCALLFDYVR